MTEHKVHPFQIPCLRSMNFENRGKHHSELTAFKYLCTKAASNLRTQGLLERSYNLKSKELVEPATESQSCPLITCPSSKCTGGNWLFRTLTRRCFLFVQCYCQFHRKLLENLATVERASGLSTTTGHHTMQWGALVSLGSHMSSCSTQTTVALAHCSHFSIKKID